MAKIYNSDQLDLTAFIATGGKMIVWHGWADAIVTPYKTVDWYEQLSSNMGGREELEKNVRLFMIPVWTIAVCYLVQRVSPKTA